MDPNDSRKIENYLRIYKEKGKIPSVFIEENKIDDLRFENSIVFWPKIKTIEEFKKQIVKRIDEMLNEEGINEIISILNEQKSLKNSDKGIMQAIGKNFNFVQI